MFHPPSFDVPDIWRGLATLGQHHHFGIPLPKQVSVCERLVELIEESLLQLTPSVISEVRYRLVSEYLPGSLVKHPKCVIVRSVHSFLGCIRPAGLLETQKEVVLWVHPGSGLNQLADSLHLLLRIKSALQNLG